MKPHKFDSQLKKNFSEEQLEKLSKLRIWSTFQLCAFAQSSKHALDLLADELQMPHDDLENLVGQLLATLLPMELEKLGEFNLLEKGMGLRKKQEGDQ